MISIVIPTFNRGYILEKTLKSYYEQDLVSEIIVVDDGGNDHTQQVLDNFKERYPSIQTKYIQHPIRKGAAAARNTGVAAAENEYVMFGEDDALPSHQYVAVLYDKLISTSNCAATSGRLIQMRAGETNEEARERFGNGLTNQALFSPRTLLLNVEARLEEDQKLPILPAVILTTKELLVRYPFDERYSRGNGYREETTFQAAVYSQGYDLLLTNDVYCFHLPRSHVHTGGQRTLTLLHYFWWCLYFNHMFLKQFYAGYKKRMNLKMPKIGAEIAFLCFQFSIVFVKPAVSFLIKCLKEKAELKKF